MRLSALHLSALLIRLPYRGQHLDVVVEVAHKSHDGHALIEAFDATELHHEAVFVAQSLQRFPVPLVLP